MRVLLTEHFYRLGGMGDPVFTRSCKCNAVASLVSSFSTGLLVQARQSFKKEEASC